MSSRRRTTEFNTFRAKMLVGSIAKARFQGVARPAEDDWRPIETAPQDDTPIWSKNEMMSDAIISRRGHGDRRDVWQVLADPLALLPASPGLIHFPTVWQPLVRGDAS